jgi:hypothetical protein
VIERATNGRKAAMQTFDADGPPASSQAFPSPASSGEEPKREFLSEQKRTKLVGKDAHY